ncbi:hypothetical protein OFC58_39680, partial [Escherichia coli]|nr:hypothetical protein [Escherichia coli]
SAFIAAWLAKNSELTAGGRDDGDAGRQAGKRSGSPARHRVVRVAAAPGRGRAARGGGGAGGRGDVGDGDSDGGEGAES